ncbi:unnamed protein product [Laminaria digitata]
MLSCACWMPGNRPSRALAPAVRASLRKPRFDRLPTTLPNYNNWSRSTVSRAVSLEGSSTAPRRRLWTDTTITHHLGNVKHRYLSQEPARLQQEHAADGDNPSEIAAAAAMAAAAEEGCAGSDASHATHARHASHAGTVKPGPRLDGLGVNSSGDSNSAKGGAGAMVFRLSSDFVSTEGLDSKPVFGFNGLGELVYQRTYARYLGDDSDDREEWYQTVERVVNGTFSMQKEWMLSQGMPWDEQEAQKTAQEMYRRMFAMKFLPPGRGLWAMGSKLTTERRLYAALNNCAFVSTKDLAEDPTAPFCFLMDAAMLGVGVGFDTKGAGTIDVVAPGSAEGVDAPGETCFVVDDSREGWRDALKAVLESYFFGRNAPALDTSQLRPAGAPIRGFGGVSQGSAPLVELMASVKASLDPLVGKPLSVTAIVDIMNKVGVCVIAGNVRRTAEIAFGDAGSEEYIDLKNYEKNPDRVGFGWASNNSVLAKLGMDYTKICERIEQNGEPGFAWLENMRQYGRMGDEKNHRDARAMGGNPCLEQTLESFEMCCLVETFPDKHESLEDFLETLRFAFMYAKTVTLGGTHWDKTNEILYRNRRIGCSMSGLAQFVASRGLGTLQEWCEEGYIAVSNIDKELSGHFNIPTSIKTTSIKPSGTVSLLAGATPGMHYPESRFYLRRVRISADAHVLGALRDAGYRLEPSATDPEGTVVVEVPVDAGEGMRTARDLSIWEQLSFAAFLQRYWADNQASTVSCTITFDPETEGQHLAHALDYFQYQLKGVSFLPRIDYGAFPQMPYEAISEEQYKSQTAKLQKLDFKRWQERPRGGGGGREARIEEVPDKFCETDACTTSV